MYKKIDLSGLWNFELDEAKQGIMGQLNDTITLPNTTSNALKGKKNEAVELGHLTDEYKYDGQAWFSKKVSITEDLVNKNCYLFLERTRKTTVFINEKKIGSQNSLCTPHAYDISGHLKAGENTITICVDNTDYPTGGGHLTSPDTQSNWNGIVGRIELQFFNKSYIDDVEIYSDISDKSVTVKAHIIGAERGTITVCAEGFNEGNNFKSAEKEFDFTDSKVDFKYVLGEGAPLWSEYEPNVFKLFMTLEVDGQTVDKKEVIFGLREFKADHDKFTINGKKTFLRGKHDGMIFPLTGFMPTTVEEWVKVLKISKAYGINHYRFHTCCPPEEAFTAADLVGIYMQPELPFWGTITDENDENHNQAEQDYLVNEGFLILKAYGNHPSFVMMSLGNELWGSQQRLNNILGQYKAVDKRHLYVQGSNNFQWVPVILENDDFFSGVRFTKERRIRGSYAMCDAPLGHVQTDFVGTMKDYDEAIIPAGKSGNSAAENGDGTIEIQYGTGVKKVKAGESTEEFIPDVPVVSHEIGQYETFPDFNEIKKYTGPLKARNFEVFKKRLEDKGLLDLADKYFKCSGKLAVDCYKEELEAAFRSRKMAGFQILDIQDYSGQGTALVGILDAFMESKNLVSPEEWRSFCSDAVLLARFPKYNYIEREVFKAHVELAYYRNIKLDHLTLSWNLCDDEKEYLKGKSILSHIGDENYIDIADIAFKMPKVTEMKKLKLTLKIDKTDIEKYYDLYVYPHDMVIDKSGVNIFSELNEEAETLLKNGKNVLLLPKIDSLKNSIAGCYATDFWCYPMFRSISESMNKPIPVGTMGLLINNTHPALKYLASEEYSTQCWNNIVRNSRTVILDDTAKSFRPIVQTIDNFERNHKLGMMFEANVLNGKVFVCTCDFDKVIDRPEGKQLLYSILSYIKSDEFKPKNELKLTELTKVLFGEE